MSQSPRLILVMALVAVATASSRPSHARDVAPLEIGAKAPDFRLPGVDGKTYTLADFSEAKLLMIIFTCNHCPTAQAYEDRILALHRDYRERGVALVAISPNDPLAVRLDELGYTDLSDSFEEMKIRARDRGFEFPYLYDGETQETSAAYGVLATPQVFLFDQERTLRYMGRIDDSEVKAITRHDTRNALDALLAEQPVPAATTRVFGCSTKWSDKREDARRSLARWDEEPVELQLIGEEQLQEVVQNRTDKYRLINVWATWCAPCVAEMPDFVTIHRMYRHRKFEWVTVSADDPQAREDALKLLGEKHASGTNYLFNSASRDALFDSIDPQWQGAVPYTILVAPGGQVVYRQHGPIDPLELKKAIVNRIGRTYAYR